MRKVSIGTIDNMHLSVALVALLLSEVQLSFAQSSDAVCTDGTASEVNIEFDPDSYNRYTGPGTQVKRWHKSGKLESAYQSGVKHSSMTQQIFPVEQRAKMMNPSAHSFSATYLRTSLPKPCCLSCWYQLC
jgi:coproporphyrinogen III oxidase